MAGLKAVEGRMNWGEQAVSRVKLKRTKLLLLKHGYEECRRVNGAKEKRGRRRISHWVRILATSE